MPQAAAAAFAAELVQLRLQSGMSTHELAEQLGIQPGDVDLAEAGQRCVDVVELFHWCQTCGSSLDAFAERMDRRASAGVLSSH
jgi:transcriptional regulator with XRE-family HTH domain